MSAHDSKSTERPPPDAPLVAIADYARNAKIRGATAYDTARYCLMDTLACGFQALKYPACRKLLGPVVPGAVMPGGARVPGTRAPPVMTAPGTTGPKSLRHAGYFSAWKPQARVSMRS